MRGWRQTLEGCGHKPRSTWNHQELEEAGRILPWSLGREQGPSNTWLSDSCPPELREYISVFISPWLCYSSRRK